MTLKLALGVVQVAPEQSTPVPLKVIGVLEARDLRIWVCWANLTPKGIAKIKIAKKSSATRLVLVSSELEFIIIYVYIYIRGLFECLST